MARSKSSHTMTPYPTNTIIAQAISSAIDSVLAKSQHELRGLLRDFCETTAHIFIQQQQQRTTQIFEEAGKDEVSESFGAKRNHDQTQVHALEDPHDQVRDFVGMPIYDVYDDALSPTLVHESCGETHHESLVISQEGDKSICDISDAEEVVDSHYYIDPLFHEEETQGFHNDGDIQVLFGDAYIGVKKQYLTHDLGEKDCHHQFHHEPPDRGRHKKHTYVDLVATHKRLTNGSTYTELLEETELILKPEHDQEVCLSEFSLIGKHALENKITYLQGALALEKEKNMNLESILNETHKKICMLNKGSASLDKILSMGRTEKSTMGLGYQGESSTSETVFVRGKFFEQNKTRVDLDDEFSCVTMSKPLEWGDTKDNYDFTSLANLLRHITSERPDHDQWEFFKSEEHLDYKFDGDPLFYFSDEKLVNDVYIYELWAKSYAVASTIRHKSVRDKFLWGTEVLIPGMVAHVHLLEFTSLYASFLRSNDETWHQMLSCDFISDVLAALMLLFHMRGLMFPLAMAKRWEPRPNRVLQSLDFLNHSQWELEQTISFVLICCFVCVPSFAKEEAYTLNNIQGKLLYSWYMEIDESVFHNLVLLYSFSVSCRDFHYTSVAVLMTLVLEVLLGIHDDLNIFRVTGETRMRILPPPLTDDASGGENENTVAVDFHKGQHEMTELAVMDRIYEVVSFRGRPALFLPWFSGDLAMTGFSDVLFSEFVRITRISLHHPIFDLLVDQKSFGDREKNKLDIKGLVAKINCFFDDKEESKLLRPPGNLTVRARLPFTLLISPVGLQICLVSVSIITTTKVMQSAKTFFLQVGVCYEVFKKGVEVLFCKCGFNYSSTRTMEWTDVACDSSKWVICSFFHRVFRFVHGAVILGSPSCVHCSLLLWKKIQDVDECLDTRSKRLTVFTGEQSFSPFKNYRKLVAVTLIRAQLCLVQPTCLHCCFIQDLSRLMDCDFSFDDVVTVSDHAFCYLRTREHVFQEESLFSCALWKHNLVFSNIYNGSREFSMQLTINSGDLHLVQVKKIICMAYHVRRFLFHRGNRMLFWITERMPSFVRQSWSSLASGYVSFVSSLHELHYGVLKSEFDVVRLRDLELVFVILTTGGEHVDVTVVNVQSSTFQVEPFSLRTSPDFTRNNAQAMEFEGPYDKLEARKFGPLESLEQINANVRLALPPHVHTADVINVKRWFKFEPGDALLSGFVDESLEGGGT